MRHHRDRDETILVVDDEDAVRTVIGGRELASRLRAVRGEMKLLYMSGYGERAFEDFRIVPAGRICLSKPFTNRELAWRVREVLDGGSAA